MMVTRRSLAGLCAVPLLTAGLALPALSQQPAPTPRAAADGQPVLP